MKGDELDISLDAMAERGGVTVPAFHWRGWPDMTLEERIKDSKIWRGNLNATVAKKSHLSLSLVEGEKAMEKKIAELKKFEDGKPS